MADFAGATNEPGVEDGDGALRSGETAFDEGLTTDRADWRSSTEGGEWLAAAAAGELKRWWWWWATVTWWWWWWCTGCWTVRGSGGPSTAPAGAPFRGDDADVAAAAAVAGIPPLIPAARCCCCCRLSGMGILTLRTGICCCCCDGSGGGGSGCCDGGGVGVGVV